MKKLTPDEQIRVSNIPAFKGSWWKDSWFWRNILGWFNIYPKLPHREIKQLKQEKHRPFCNTCKKPFQLRWVYGSTQDIGDAIYHEWCQYLSWNCDCGNSYDEHEHEHLEKIEKI